MTEAAWTHVGVTATREGVTPIQLQTFRSEFESFEVDYFHHGCCVGGDHQAATIARENGVWVVGHPPTARTYLCDFQNDEERSPLQYLDRNRQIVREVGILFAMPKESSPQFRGGTWSTYRYAKDVGLHVVLILPDGKMEVYHGKELVSSRGR